MTTSPNPLYIRSFKTLIKVFLFLAILNFSCVVSANAQTDPVQEILQSRMSTLQDTGTLVIDGNKIAARRLLPELYSRRHFTLAWQDQRKREELIGILRHIDEEGLNPADYLLSSLLEYQAQENKLTDADRVDFDILLTESLVRLGYHLRFGKVDPKNLDSNWNLNRSLENEDPATLIQAAIDSGSLKAFIDREIPRQDFYLRYKEALADYRHIKEQGGWPEVPPGPALKPGMQDPRIAILKQRLQIEAYLNGPDAAAPPEYYDAALEEAVSRFQHRHGLGVDGVAGKQTLEALNVSVGDRIDQIRVNLERSRWVFADIQGEFFIINIAGFKAYFVRDDKLIWTSRVMVGRRYRKTPVFKSQIKYMLLNPTWTVPPGILRKDILPRAGKDPGYIRAQRFAVLDQKGNQVDPDTIDWASYAGKNFPYTLRQASGPDNALGRIKFVFPNSHFVYLHDTPHKELFDRPERTFSSGCIRIENPLELAVLLLNDSEKWSREKIEAAIATEKTQTINLPHPVTIMLLYWTVVIEPDGTVSFRDDIYGRDKKVLEALDGEFNISLPEGLPERYYN
jgi:murein L,D-transpeptidase YcbB/YkuD